MKPEKVQKRNQVLMAIYGTGTLYAFGAIQYLAPRSFWFSIFLFPLWLYYAANFIRIAKKLMQSPKEKEFHELSSDFKG